MAQLTAQISSGTSSSGLDLAGGLNPLYTAASAGGDSYPNSGREVLLLHNGDASSHTATITAQSACTLGRLHTVTVVVGSGLYVQAGPFAPNFFNDVNGMVNITYSSVTNIQVAVVHP